jgi:hypothetical protein
MESSQVLLCQVTDAMHPGRAVTELDVDGVNI